MSTPRVAWSVAEFAEAMGVSVWTVYRLIDKGDLGWFQLSPGSDKRIPNSELERLFAEAAERRSVAS